MTEKPMHTAKAGKFKLEVFYQDDGRYRVVVSGPTDKREDYVQSTYEPRFGIDAADMADIGAMAEKMCLEMEGKA
jgi:hypothetical protein